MSGGHGSPPPAWWEKVAGRTDEFHFEKDAGAINARTASGHFPNLLKHAERA
ncbi:hypothetical protein SF83666_c32920 [Sinorhizobium fredii CCBAU 83666]|nr:hypothetical protein SF83666_c32920 [Sinorhizobium fredii CCBAU 83666]